MALFTEILGAPKGHKSGAGVQKSLNFSQVRKFYLFFHVFIFLLQTTAYNSHASHDGGRVYVKKIKLTILITYFAPQASIVNDLGCAFAILCSLEQEDTS